MDLELNSKHFLLRKKKSKKNIRKLSKKIQSKK